MVKISKFLLISLVVFGLMLFSAATICKAEEAADTTDATTVSATNIKIEQLLDQNASLADEPQELIDVTIAEPTGVPSNFGLWWRGLREQISLALTFDPVKKAEKSLVFAEERVKLANYITENSDDPKIQAKAQQVLEKANQYVQRIEDRQGELLNNTSEKVKNLMSNLSAHYANKELVLEKLEDKLPAEQLEQFQKLRQDVETRTTRFLNNLTENENVPAKVKEKIMQVKERVEEKLKAREEFRAEQKDILEEIKAGSQAAKEQFQQLREEKLQTMEQAREQFKIEAQKIIDQIKAGVPEAIEELKQLNQTRQEEVKNLQKNIKTKVEEIKGEVQEVRQQNLNQLKQNNSVKPTGRTVPTVPGPATPTE